MFVPGPIPARAGRVLMSETMVRPLDILDFETELPSEPHFLIPPLDVQVGVGGFPLIPVLVGLTALAVTSTGLNFGMASFYNSEASKVKIAEIAKNVDALLLGQKDILAELKRLSNEVEWGQIVTVIARPIQIITNFVEEMRRLLPDPSWDPAKIAAWRLKKEPEVKAWAKAVLAMTDGGVRLQLSSINGAFKGTGGIHKPLLQILIEKVKDAKAKSQSSYFIAFLKYHSIKYFEAQALGALAGAYAIEHPAETEQQVKDWLKTYQDPYEQQITDSLPLLSPLARFWTAPYKAIGGEAPINWTPWHIIYVDALEVKADDGYVVVGLQFYKKVNRLALEITQAKLDASGDIDAASKKKKANSEWKEEYYQLGANTTMELMTTVVPSLCMVSGVKLLQDGNKFMVLLEYVPFDFTTRKADFTKRKWTSAADAKPSASSWLTSDPNGSVAPDSPNGRVGTAYDVTPDPLSPITGVMLYNQSPNTTEKIWYVLPYTKTDFWNPDTPKKA